jgi:hypothetical protein
VSVEEKNNGVTSFDTQKLEFELKVDNDAFSGGFVSFTSNELS